MGREKLNLTLIACDKFRKKYFFRRKDCVMKKARELSTLCDVPVGIFVYGPNSSSGEVYSWPDSRNDIDKLISSYKSDCVHKRTRKVSGLKDLFTERKNKIDTEISKLRKEVVETKYLTWDDRLDCLSEDQLRLLMSDLDSKRDAVKGKMNFITTKNRDGVSGSGIVNANFGQELLPFEGQTETLTLNMFGDLDSKLDAVNERIDVITTENRDGAFGRGIVIANFGQELVFFEGQTETLTPNMFGDFAMETQMKIPSHPEIQGMNQNFDQMGNSTIPMLPIDHHYDMESLSQLTFDTNGSAQIQFNYDNFQTPNVNYFDTNNYGIMEMNNNMPMPMPMMNNQNYSMSMPMPMPMPMMSNQNYSMAMPMPMMSNQNYSMAMPMPMMSNQNYSMEMPMPALPYMQFKGDQIQIPFPFSNSQTLLSTDASSDPVNEFIDFEYLNS